MSFDSMVLTGEACATSRRVQGSRSTSCIVADFRIPVDDDRRGSRPGNARAHRTTIGIAILGDNLVKMLQIE